MLSKKILLFLLFAGHGLAMAQATNPEHRHSHNHNNHQQSMQPDTGQATEPVQQSQAEVESQTTQKKPKVNASKKSDILVTGKKPSRISASPTNVVIGGTDLTLRTSSTLGESLNAQLGFNTSSYGQGASRPIIRGMDGARVRILNNSTEIMDASSMGHDHNVAVEPLLADKIEFSRGPADLAYGSGAIGGVVNIIDNKIPSYIPENGYEGSLQTEVNTVAEERVGAFSITAGKGNFAFHLDGLDRKSYNYRIGRGWIFKRYGWGTKTYPGSTTGPELVFGEINEEREKVPTSFNGTETLSAGGSYIADNGYLGFSYTKQKNHYGIPGHGHPFDTCILHSDRTKIICQPPNDLHDHSLPIYAPNIRLASNRWEMRGELRDISNLIEKISINANLTDYKHIEYHGERPGTEFKNRGFDSRIELQHKPLFAGVKGVFGAQVTKRDFKLLGNEQGYVSPTVTDKYGIYWLGEKQLNTKFNLSSGLRYDYQQIKVDSLQPNTKHYGASASFSSKWQYSPQHAATLSLIHNQRAPSSEELYADGVHDAANMYELGNPWLKSEKSNNLDLTFEGAFNNQNTSYILSLYYNNIKDYMYARTLDQYKSYGPLIGYSQDDAVFHGFEASLKQELGNGIAVRVFGDYVKAKLKNADENAPRIPPIRYGLTFFATKNNWQTEIEVYRVAKQNTIAPYETETAGYTMLNAKFSYNVTTRLGDLQFYAKGNNLSNNKVIYSHTSIVKDQAPMMGRNITMGVKYVF